MNLRNGQTATQARIPSPMPTPRSSRLDDMIINQTFHEAILHIRVRKFSKRHAQAYLRKSLRWLQAIFPLRRSLLRLLLLPGSLRCWATITESRVGLRTTHVIAGVPTQHFFLFGAVVEIGRIPRALVVIARWHEKTIIIRFGRRS